MYRYNMKNRENRKYKFIMDYKKNTFIFSRHIAQSYATSINKQTIAACRRKVSGRGKSALSKL